jgi:peptide/nickel transport system substrate-binding protein
LIAREHHRHRGASYAALFISFGLIAAACGGGSKKSTTATTEQATTSTSPGETTSTLAAGDAATSTTVAGSTSASVNKSTATTVGSTTKTTKKTGASATTIPKPSAQGNLLNVQATTSTTAGGKAPQPGGSITVALAADTVNFDPANGSSNSSATEGPRNSAIFDTLFFQDSTTYDLVAQLAAGITSTDGKVWDLHLRPNVKFTDGTTLDAEAVKFNINRIKDPATTPSPNRSAANQITDMTATDPLTLRMTLSAPSGQFPRILGSTIPWIGSPTAIQKQGAADFAVHPVGAGPFMLKEYVRGDHTLLVRNPGYWNAPLPYLDQINIRIIPDDSQRLNSLYTGEIQMGRVNRPQDCADAKGKKFGCSVAILNGGNDLIFNNSKFPFNNKTFRQAVGEAIDRDAYNQQVEGGFGLPVSSMFQPTSPFYEPDIVVSKYDPADAAAKFKQVFDANGGKKIPFTISASQGKSFDAATFFQGQLLQNGSGPCKACTFSQYLDVNLQQVTTVSLVSNSVNGTFDAQVWANLPLDPEPNLFISFRSGSTTNFNRYSNPQVDAALDTEHTSLDPAARKAAMRTFQQVWADEQPSFMYARVQQGFVYNSSIQDVRLFEDGTALLDRIWLQK